MISKMSRLLAFLILLFSLTSCSFFCNLFCTQGARLISGQVFMWISTDQDTYISRGRTSENGDNNYGWHSPLVVASWDLANKKTYVHFELPNLPAGTEIIEAYVELNHNAKNEDGKTDDLKIPASRPKQAWDAMTLTWNNSADKPPLASITNICLRSQDWSTTPNIANEIQGKREFDLILYWNWPGAQPAIEKGFASNNDFSRKQNDLGIAPRLLIRAQLPQGVFIPDRQVKTFQPNEDLGKLPQPVLMMTAQSGTNWPTVWEVTSVSNPCN